MAQNATTMYDTVDKVIMSAPATINRLDQLVEERSWESVLAHLQTIQGREDAMRRNSTMLRRVYHDRDFYNNAPFHVIEALVKAYPEGIVEPMYITNQIHLLVQPLLDWMVYCILT